MRRIWLSSGAVWKVKPADADSIMLAKAKKQLAIKVTVFEFNMVSIHLYLSEVVAVEN